MSTATTTDKVLIYTEARTSTALSRRQMGPRDGWVPCGESTGTVTDNDRTPDPVYWLDEFVKPEVRELDACWADLEESGWAFEVRTAVVGEDGTEAELWRLTFYVEDGECEFTWDLEA